MIQPTPSLEVTAFYAYIEYYRGNIDYATMVKLVNTTDLKSVASELPGSSPGGRTNFNPTEVIKSLPTSIWDCFDEKM